MAFPRNIAGMLEKHPDLANGRIFSSKYTCQGSKFHSPTPLVVHRVIIKQKVFFLCGTCQDNAELLVDLIQAEKNSVPWIVLREFGTQIRKLVCERTKNG